MKVIGAGMPRTGTMSMQAALNHLGYPCYHMEEVMRSQKNIKVWHQFISGQADIDWQVVFQEYEATVDAPACFYYSELVQAFPDAKVILTVREPEGWYKSVMKLHGVLRRLRPLGYIILPLGRALNFAYDLHRKYRFPIGSDDKALYFETFMAHNAAVQKRVPADKLLIFEVKEGWEPLCAFLGCDVPDIPFPHLNSGGETVSQKFQEVFVSKPVRMAAVAVVLLLVFVGWLFWG